MAVPLLRFRSCKDIIMAVRLLRFRSSKRCYNGGTSVVVPIKQDMI